MEHLKCLKGKEYTSTVIQKVSAVKTGRITKLSGVVRSVNQKAPPFLKEGTFSVMFWIYKLQVMNEETLKKESNKIKTK